MNNPIKRFQFSWNSQPNSKNNDLLQAQQEYQQLIEEKEMKEAQAKIDLAKDVSKNLRFWKLNVERHIKNESK